MRHSPFGHDDVDFPVDRWVAELRGCALVLHKNNRICRKPHKPAELLKEDEEEEEEEEDEDGDGGDGGGDDGGDDGGE